MTAPFPRRIALLGVHLESNAFAPVTREADFRSLCYLEGDAIIAEARAPAPALPAEVAAFVAAMDRLGPWTPVPILVAAAEPGGPADARFVASLIAAIRARLAAAMPCDGVYVSNHGGMTSTEDADPDGAMLEAVRDVVGAEVPIVATLDLHANISERMADKADVLIAYRTNPHVDQRERGAEAARVLAELMGGARSYTSFVRLPLTPASVSLLTASGPYADLIARGQALKTQEIIALSVVGGFVFSDTRKNGLAIVVSARDGVASARRVALELARQAWRDRQRFVKRLTPLAEAVRLALEAGRDLVRPAIIFSDSGDNPGGGGGGNTTELLEALYRAKAARVLYGVFIDALLAAEAHKAGVGAKFEAIFNRGSADRYARPFAAPARVLALHDGKCVGRRGLWAGQSLDLGPAAALDLGGITAVVGSRRKQTADPVFFEMLGLNIADARTVAVKSRGHFRAGLDEFFRPEQVYEVDTAGLTSPNLDRVPFKGLPRPVFPLDPDTEWREPAFP
ncbi:MAG TPA: M81 family metallopeptidase [Alphaproteobacteria bacterium]